jgi:RNA polymerase sigma-70 factor (ECF subfamily)
MISPQFLNECLSGSEDAIQTLIRNHQRPVFQLALSILDDTAASPADSVAQAEIVTRDTFMKALDRLPAYREDMSFTTWLYRITIEVSYRHLRGLRMRRFLARLTGRRSGQASTAPVEREGIAMDDALWQSVRRLDDKLRVPVVLRYYHEYPINEIAKLLRISEGAVHARLDAAREKIAGSV